MASKPRADLRQPHRNNFFKNLFGLLRLNRFYRKTRTNILILHHKGVINLNYIYFFGLLTIISTLGFYFTWTILLFPRSQVDPHLSGFEHYPKHLLPVDMFNRKHYHISTAVCQDQYRNVVKLIKELTDLSEFDTELEGAKKALHFHIFTRDTSFEDTTMAIDDLLYPPVATQQQIKNPSNIKFHLHNADYEDCHLTLALSGVTIADKVNHYRVSNNENNRNPPSWADLGKRFNRLLALSSSEGSLEALGRLDVVQQKRLLGAYETASGKILKITTLLEEKNENNTHHAHTNPNTNTDFIGYIFDPSLSDDLPDTGSLDRLINSEWRTGVDVILQTLFREKIFDLDLSSSF